MGSVVGVVWVQLVGWERGFWVDEVGSDRY